MLLQKVENSLNNFVQRTITSLILFGGLIALVFYLPPIFLTTIIMVMFVLILTFEWPTLMRTMHWRALPITLFYLCVPIYCLISLLYASPRLLFFLICLVALFDTSAYIAGKLAGKHKMVPSISPGKSWEGFFGGFFVILMALIYCSCQPKNYFILFILACSISSLAFAGDLFESWLKRKAGVKNSGTLLPGHGGILDRIDGLLPVSILFFIFKNQLLSSFCL